MKALKTIMAALAATVLAGCQEKIDPVGPSGTEVTVSIDMEGMQQDTKSSFTWSDTFVHDWEVIMVNTSTGKVEDAVFTTGGQALSLKALVGQPYRFYALVNNGSKVTPTTTQTMGQISLPVSYDNITKYGIPMSGSAAKTIAEGSNSVSIPVKRLLARIDLKVDRSKLTHADATGGFTVKGVRVCNALSAYTPFTTTFKQTKSTGIDYSFDKASSSDLTSINAGGKISLYAFENMQGNLLSGNSDPWSKVPSSVSNSERCSYLEVTAAYSAQGLQCDDITYRMFLGGDAVSNFDVTRNTIYTVTLIPTENEIDGQRGSWKVSSHDWNDRRGLSFSPVVLNVPSLGSASSVLQMQPEPFDVTISGTAWLTQAGCTWNYDKTTGKITITNGTALSSAASGRITATSWDGAWDEDLIVNVAARKVPKSIVVSPSSISLKVGASQTLKSTVTYSDGSTAVVTPTYKVANTAIATVSGSVLKGVKAGSTTLTASYTENGTTVTSASVSVKVTMTATLVASKTTLDTWGGNSYDLTFTYTNENGVVSIVTPTLSGIIYEKVGTAGLLSYSGGKIVAKDWWGMSGTWVKSSPGYDAIFSYGGVDVTVSGTMHGTTAIKAVEYISMFYQEVTDHPLVKRVVLDGSEEVSVSATSALSFTITGTASKDYKNQYLKVGTYNTSFTVKDSTNGLVRSGTSTFEVKTDVKKIWAYITIDNLSVSTGATAFRQYVCATGSGQNIFSMNIPTNGHDETSFDIIFEDMQYEDVYGITHSLRSLGTDDYGYLPPTRKTTWGVMPQDTGPWEFSYNGFKFSIELNGI